MWKGRVRPGSARHRRRQLDGSARSRLGQPWIARAPGEPLLRPHLEIYGPKRAGVRRVSTLTVRLAQMLTASFANSGFRVLFYHLHQDRKNIPEKLGLLVKEQQNPTHKPGARSPELCCNSRFSAILAFLSSPPLPPPPLRPGRLWDPAAGKGPALLPAQTRQAFIRRAALAGPLVLSFLVVEANEAWGLTLICLSGGFLQGC